MRGGIGKRMKLWQGGGHVPAGSRGSTTRTTLALAGLLLLASLTVSVVGSTRSFAAPATFTVTTTNDSGAGSLRQAITDANSNGNPSDQDVIEFAIAGGGDQTIQPQTPLTITESVLVDGYTQGDAEENTALAPLPLDGWLRVELDLSVSGAVQVNGAGVTLRGLTLNLSPTYAVQAIGADNFQFFGNYVNTDTTGLLWRTDPAANGAVYIEDADNVRIGGMAANQRNVVSWCSNSCIEALATSGQTTNDLRIQGNLIGVGSDAVSDQGGNTVGILLKAGVTNAVIGGDRSLGAGNSVMHNFNGGIDAQDVVGLSILGNRVLANNIMNPSSYRGAVFVGGSTQVVVGDGTLNGRNVVGGQDGNNGQYSGSGVVIGNSPATSAASSEVSIEGNYIGVIDDGITPYENFGTGVLIRDNSNNVLVRSNIIRNSYNNVGIAITNSAQSVAVLQNSIYNNSRHWY